MYKQIKKSIVGLACLASLYNPADAGSLDIQYGNAKHGKPRNRIVACSLDEGLGVLSLTDISGSDPGSIFNRTKFLFGKGSLRPSIVTKHYSGSHLDTKAGFTDLSVMKKALKAQYGQLDIGLDKDSVSATLFGHYDLGSGWEFEAYLDLQKETGRKLDRYAEWQIMKDVKKLGKIFHRIEESGSGTSRITGLQRTIKF